MNFITHEFVLFFLAFLLLFRGVESKDFYKKIVLVGANLLFYNCLGIQFFVLLFEALVVYTGCVLISQKKKEGLSLCCCISLCLITLALFKYYDFFIDLGVELSNALKREGLNSAFLEYKLTYIAGISFFTFQALALLADVYKKKFLFTQSFLDVLAYLSFFPTILSGPIMRPGEFFLQYPTGSSLSKREIHEGFSYILSGLIKKVVLATYLSEHIVKGAFSAPEAYDSLSVLLAVYAYSAQIYCDFSGYSDLAVGIGRLMGYRLPQNFDSPYLSLSLQEFWRKWHITLSSWLKDYLYIPLGGNRRGNVYRNLIVTMLLGGLWHGGAWNFLCWGLLHGLGLAAHRAFSKNCSFSFAEKYPRIVNAASWFVTFNFVSLLWILFYQESFDRIFAMFHRLIFFSTEGAGFPLFVLPAILCTFFMQIFGKRIREAFLSWTLKVHWLLFGGILGVGAVLIMAMGPEGVLPFIYFGF